MDQCMPEVPTGSFSVDCKPGQLAVVAAEDLPMQIRHSLRTLHTQ